MWSVLALSACSFVPMRSSQIDVPVHSHSTVLLNISTGNLLSSTKHSLVRSFSANRTYDWNCNYFYLFDEMSYDYSCRLEVVKITNTILYLPT